MHDIRRIRENPEEFDRGLERRGLPARADEILALDRQWRDAETRLQEAQAKRNELGKRIAQAKRAGESELRQDIREAMLEVQEINLAGLSETSASLRSQIDRMLEETPNLPALDVPDGLDESANRELRRVGTPPSFDFPPLAHDVIGERLELMDFARAASLSGSRFVVLKGALAHLERALAQFMLDLHTREFGYTEVAPPLLVRREALFGTGQLPKFAEDQFRTTDDYWLIPTAEVPLTNLVAGEIIDEAKLPKRFTACTPCFRSEAGAAGRDTRGMIRMHQFNKVELVSITRPEDSEAEHERMTSCAEEVLKRLGLAYRVVVLATGDMGFSARKTYDIEVWLPAQNAYREISSCSNCGPFQAQRMKARCRPAGGKGTRPVHTLNGSALAVGRTLIAILENFQSHDGTVAIPEALQPYMGGQELIGGNG